MPAISPEDKWFAESAAEVGAAVGMFIEEVEKDVVGLDVSFVDTVKVAVSTFVVSVVIEVVVNVNGVVIGVGPEEVGVSDAVGGGMLVTSICVVVVIVEVVVRSVDVIDVTTTVDVGEAGAGVDG